MFSFHYCICFCVVGNLFGKGEEIKKGRSENRYQELETRVLPKILDKREIRNGLKMLLNEMNSIVR